MNDIEQKLRKLLRLGLHPSTGSEEAAEALLRAKHIAQRHHLDLTRLLDSAANNVPFASPTDSCASSDEQVRRYLGTMSRILEHATTLSQQLTDAQIRAQTDPQLFCDPCWLNGFQRVVDRMETVSSDIRAVTAPEPLLHIHVLYLRIAVAYQIRIRHLRTVIDCLRRVDLGAASTAFGDVTRVGELIAAMGNDLGAALARGA